MHTSIALIAYRLATNSSDDAQLPAHLEEASLSRSTSADPAYSGFRALQALSNTAIDDRSYDQPVATTSRATVPYEGWFGAGSLVLAALAEA